jgi:hypothetical protein
MPFVGSHGEVGVVVAASAPGGGSAVVRMIRAAVFFPGDLAGGTGDVGAAGLSLFWWWSSDLGFLASEDDDLPEVSLP